MSFQSGDAQETAVACPQEQAVGRTGAMDKVPVFLYHDVSGQARGGGEVCTVTPDMFERQMDSLCQEGFQGVSLERLILGVSGRPQAPCKRVVLTFDDGDLSNFHLVLPILKARGFSATFFVAVNEIGKEGRMDWSMIYELSASGMGVGSHSMSGASLTAHSAYALLHELLMSKQILEKYIRRRVAFLSVPRGCYNKRVLTTARDVGFRAVCTSDAGYNDFCDDGAFVLRRFAMRRAHGLRVFTGITDGRPPWMFSARETLRTGMRSSSRRLFPGQLMRLVMAKGDRAREVDE